MKNIEIISTQEAELDAEKVCFSRKNIFLFEKYYFFQDFLLSAWVEVVKKVWKPWENKILQ